jgi:hypothetical protein
MRYEPCAGIERPYGGPEVKPPTEGATEDPARHWRVSAVFSFKNSGKKSSRCLLLKF